MCSGDWQGVSGGWPGLSMFDEFDHMIPNYGFPFSRRSLDSMFYPMYMQPRVGTPSMFLRQLIDFENPAGHNCQSFKLQPTVTILRDSEVLTKDLPKEAEIEKITETRPAKYDRSKFLRLIQEKKQKETEKTEEEYEGKYEEDVSKEEDVPRKDPIPMSTLKIPSEISSETIGPTSRWEDSKEIFEESPTRKKRQPTLRKFLSIMHSPGKKSPKRKETSSDEEVYVASTRGKPSDEGTSQEETSATWSDSTESD